ncbi:long-chain-fatty-acid--CoA ligase [Nocardia sp. CDC159]|uniref:Long-chain-fatty-acid--CoA ligase n=1 Tax=Nocardia pulmonis TaxID=2951408 RepID=A0A9X2E5F0_9NOCA|nr:MULTISPECIES: long-chain-fatty-acid--CoA ligase [Nocardia]MCM6774569.1 long-chain-fatty-acid--CoA ligase [Nocardia pulmonis]MCM6787366.1 long-chain-fatty-acid--CoA ligase [Nocardia sp. CDC159]
MSRFLDALIANAQHSDGGITTGEPDAPRRRTWAGLLDTARRIAADLCSAGVAPGDAVAMLIGDPDRSVPVAEAIWLAGASVTVLQQPTARTDREMWQSNSLRVLRMIKAGLVVVGPPFLEHAEFLTANGIEVRTVDELGARRAPADFTAPPVGEETVALLQLTSGSTAQPKAVQVTHGNLAANVTAMAAGMRIDPAADLMVSWAPMYHDMGMIGCLALPLFTGMELVKIAPTTFIRDPYLWADLISRYRATIAAGPNFSWDILTRQLELAEAGSLDLSSVRIAASSGEPVDYRTVTALTAAGARFGLRPDSPNSCYGAAEITALATLSPLSRPPRFDLVDAVELETQRRAVPVDTAPATGARRFAVVGPPLPGIELRVVDEDGRALEPRRIGRIQVRGPSVTAAYVTVDGVVPIQDADGWVDMGDDGYLAEGEVVICGRRKDVIIMAGRNIYPIDIERAAETVTGVRAGNVIAAGYRVDSGIDVGRETFGVLAESRQVGDAAAEERIRSQIADRVAAAVGARPDRVLLLPPNRLPKTSSGKPRRFRAAELLRADHPVSSAARERNPAIPPG